MSAHDAYFLALASAILFSGASVIFTRYSRSHSVLWMNVIKNGVALLAFLLTSLALHAGGWERWDSLSWNSALFFIGSGFCGLAVGDFFLLQGFRRIGSARTLMVFSFSPLFLSLESYILFGQPLSHNQLFALILMMACVWTISYERFRKEGHWEWRGILFAILGVLLDNIGIVLSRKGFDLSPATNAFTANVFRAAAGVLPLLIVERVWGERIWQGFRRLPAREQALACFSAFSGTFLSLSLWLTALKIGHIGSLAGVGSFNPVSASLWEWILGKKRPTVYLCVALALFLAGFILLLV